MNTPALCVRASVHKLYLEIYKGSALEMREGALTNAANEFLQHGEGIAKAISNRGGPRIAEESAEFIRQNRRVKTSKNCKTSAGSLSFQCIIHAVGPNCNGRRVTNADKNLLKQTVKNVIKHLKGNIDIVTLPLISSGLFGFSKKEASECHLEGFFESAKEFKKTTPKTVRFALFSDDEFDIMITSIYQNRERFMFFKYFGRPKEQAYHSRLEFCHECKKVTKDDVMRLSQNCCSKVCDFCILQYRFTTCSQCRRGLEGCDFSFIYCRGCGKKTKDFHDCREFCLDCLQSLDVYKAYNKCRCEV